MDYKIEYIKWIDSSQSNGWHYSSDCDHSKCKDITSIGYLMKETEETIVICPHLCDVEAHDWQGCGIMTIPKCSIKERKKVELE